MPSKKKRNKTEQQQPQTVKASTSTDVSATNELFSSYFSEEEIQAIKHILKVKDLVVEISAPLLIGAVVVNKMDVVSRILNSGCSPDVRDQNNATALYWAVKCKNLDCLKILLLSGAEVDGANPNGDHIVFVAMDNKNWDERAFLYMWNNLNSLTSIEVNLLNRSGNSMLHMAIRRDWMTFIDTLANQGINIDITNSSGVTPLMIASFRNSQSILSKLIECGANVEREDNNGFIALCYAFSSVISKQLPLPNAVLERLLVELNSTGFSLKEYLQKRLSMMVNPSNLTQNNGQPISGILLHIFTYAIRFLKDGITILLELEVFQKIQLAASRNSGNVDCLKTILSILLELLQYNESCQKKIVDELKLYDLFDSSGCGDVCLEVMKKYENNKNIIWVTPLCFKAIVQVCLVKGRCQEWLQNYYEDLQPFYEQARIVFFQNKVSDEKTYNKMKRFEVLMNLLISGEKICKKIIYSKNLIVTGINTPEKSKDDSLLDGKTNSRKSKRRTKALKAKIAKFKTAELTERLNSSAKKTIDIQEIETPRINVEMPLPSLYEPTDLICDEKIPIMDEQGCEIVNSIKNKLLIGMESESEKVLEKIEEKYSYANYDWKSKILSMPFNVKPKMQVNSVDSYEDDFCLKPDDMSIFTSETANVTDLGEESIEALLYPSIKYLHLLLNKIIDRYHKYWIIDYQLEKEVEENSNETKIKPDECIEQTKLLQTLEEEKTETLRREFEEIILYIKETATNDIQQSHALIKKVENILLTHEIRGTTIIAEVCPSETVYITVTMPENVELPSPSGAKNALIQYLEDVLNSRQEPIENINIAVTEPQIKSKGKNYISDDILYMKEMAVLPKAKSSKEAKSTSDVQKKTLKHAYHLQSSMLDVCEDSEEEQNEKTKDSNLDYNKLSKTMMFFNKSVYSNRPKLSFTDTFMDPLKKSDDEGEASRWCTLVRSLEMMEDSQAFLNGAVRISCKEKRQSHVISTGGNFTPVELGLDSCNRPLAVKRIPKGSCVCKMIKSMLVELLDLRHRNLLHYFACDYDTNELIIATPLCEYNVGQYLMLMKQNQTNLTAIDVVKQFLTGLLFLHDRAEPIIHGNLKPSNIFVDINGVVKIAEFGIHRALFKFKEAPNSSIIWFATETYQTFKQLSLMKCTCASDIQVAGMLVHFLMTAGKHPYGEDMRIILKNLDKAMPQLSANDLELQDLITWMLLYDPTERPTIQQVLTHVYFWSSERKWKFLLACAGLGNCAGSPVFKLDDLHICLDKVASKDNIKGKWVQVLKKQFPKMSFISNDDTPTGLLKFIKTYMDNKDNSCYNKDLNLSNLILTAFPAFALSLYRMLENSVWVKHSTFSGFYSTENIFN